MKDRNNYIGREVQLELIEGALKNMIDDLRAKNSKDDKIKADNLYFFYGEAGIGKSTLLKMLEKDYDEKKAEYDKKIKIHFINWEFEDSTSIMDIIVSLKNLLSDKLNFNFYEFDYLAYKYYSQKGQEYGMPELPTISDQLDKNSITKILGTVGEFIPNLSVVKAFGDIVANGRTYLKNKGLDEKYNTSDWTEETFEKEVIRAFISDYNNSIDGKKEIVVLEFDTFDIAQIKLKRKAWMLNDELLNNLFQTISIVAGRNKPDIDFLSSDAIDKVKSEELLGFTKKEIYDYLNLIDMYMDPELKDHISESSHTTNSEYGNPLYLALCKNIYLELRERGEEPSKSDFSPVFEDLVERLLIYKTKEESDTLTVLSILESWTNDLAYSIMEKMMMPSFLLNYDQALNSEFISKLNTNIPNLKPSEESYFMNKSLALTISRKSGSYLKFKIAEIATDYYLKLAVNSLAESRNYIKWKLKTLDESEIIPFMVNEFYKFESGPLKGLNEGIKGSYFIRKYILDIFIEEVDAPQARFDLLNRRAEFYLKEKVSDYLSAINDLEEVYELAKIIPDELVLQQEYFDYIKNREDLLFSVQRKIAELHKKTNEYEKAFKVYNKGLDSYVVNLWSKVYKSGDFLDSYYDKGKCSDDLRQKSINKELETIKEYFTERNKQGPDLYSSDIRVKFKEFDVYFKLDDINNAIKALEEAPDILNRSIGQDILEEYNIPYFMGYIYDDYIKVAEKLYDQGKEDEAYYYLDKIIDDGYKGMSRGIEHMSLLAYSKKDAGDYEPAFVNRKHMLKASLDLYKYKEDYRVFEVYKYVFENAGEHIGKSRYESLSDLPELFKGLIQVIAEKGSLENYQNEIDDLFKAYITYRHEINKDKAESKVLTDKIDTLEMLKDLNLKVENFHGAIDQLREMIEIEEGLKRDSFGLFYLTNKIEEYSELLLKVGNTDEAINQKIKLETIKLRDGIKDFKYSYSSSVLEFLNEYGEMELYIKLYEDFAKECVENPELNPIQVLYALNCRLMAYNKIEVNDLETKTLINKAVDETYEYYTKNFAGNPSEKYKIIGKASKDQSFSQKDAIMILGKTCKILFDMISDDNGLEEFYDKLIYITFEQIIYAIFEKNIENNQQKQDLLIWVTGKPKGEISQLYKIAYLLPEKKMQILNEWENKKKGIAELFGEKSNDFFLANLYSKYYAFVNEKSSESLSEYLQFLEDSKSFVDKYSLVDAKEELIKANNEIIEDEELVKLFDEVYQSKKATKGSKADESVEFLKKYSRVLIGRKLYNKTLEILDKIDDLGFGDDNKILKLLKLKAIVGVSENNCDDSYKEAAEKILKEFENSEDKKGEYLSKIIYGIHLCRLDKDKEFTYIYSNIKAFTEDYDEYSDPYEEVNFKGMLYFYINLYLKARDFDKAEKLVKIFIEKITDIGLWVTEDYCNIMYEQGKKDELIKYINDILSNDFPWLYRADTVENLYDLYKKACIDQGYDYIEKTKTYLEKWQELYELGLKFNNKFYIVEAGFISSIFYKGLGEFDKALSCLNNAKDSLWVIKFKGSYVIVYLEKIINDSIVKIEKLKAESQK